MRRRIRHSSSTAQWTEGASSLARKRQQPILAARIAMKTQEAEFLDAAEKRFQLFGDDLVHQAFFGMSRSIVLRCRLHILPDKQGLGQTKSLNHKRFSGPSANCGTMLYGSEY